MRSWLERNLALAIGLGLMALAPAPALAKATRADLDAAYAHVLKDPADRALTLDYAAIAVELGDFEAAIPPLERILMNEPDNAVLKLQVGIFYRELGSKVMARQYFNDVLATNGASPEVMREAEEHLRDL